MKATITLTDGTGYTLDCVISVTTMNGQTAITHWDSQRKELATSTYGADVAIVITAE